MSASDTLLSEKPAVELDPYSVWSETNQIEDLLDSQKGYADYLRTKHLEAGIYDSNVENEIRTGLVTSARDNGLIDPEDPEAGKKLFSSPEPSFDEKLRNAQNTLSSDTPEWAAITQYNSFKNAIADRTDVPEEYLATGEEYRIKAEEAVAATSEDVLRMKIRNNEIPFAKVTKIVDGKEQTEILASDSATKMPLIDAIRASKAGGIGLSDALYAKNELETPEGYSLPLYKVKRAQEAAAMIQSLAKNDESVAAQVDGYANRLARSEFDMGDTAEYLLNSLGQSMVNVAGRVMKASASEWLSGGKTGEGIIYSGQVEGAKDIDKKQAFRDKSEQIALSDTNSIAADVAKKINASGAIRDSEAFTVDEVRLAMNEVGINEANNKGYFQFHDGKDEIGKNVRSYGYGLPQVPTALMANKAKFDEALAARPDISADIKAKMEGQRQSFVDSRFSEFNKVLTRSDSGEEWLGELQKARAAGQKDSVTLETFLSNPKNYNEFSQRAKGIVMSVVDGIGGSLATIPMLAGSKYAQDYLANIAQESSDRHEVANLFGVDFGVGQELAESVAPMLIDMAATTALATITAPAAGVGGASYLAAKQGARLTMKGLVKGMTSGVLREAAGETAEVAAKRLVAEGLIKQSVKDAGVDGAMAAINGYSGQLANKLNIVATSFIPAANREMGSSYGTMFNQLRKDPTLTREEAHDRALGGAMASGLVTGLVTSAFAGFGRGGLDTALTKGLSRSEMKTMMERLINSGNKIPNSQFNEIITTQLKNTFKEYGYASLGKEVTKNAFDEGVEEGIGTFINTFVQDATMNENTPMLERFNQTFHAFVIGGAMGAAVPAIQSAMPTFNADVKRNAARNLENKAIDDVTNKLNESGSPLSAEAVRVLLTSSARRREAAATAFEPVAQPTVDVTTTTTPEELAKAGTAAATKSTAQLNASLKEVTPADVQRLMSSVRPEEIKSTGQFDVGVYVPTDVADAPSNHVPFSSLDFKQSKPVAEKLGLDYNDFISSEVQQANSVPTIIPKIDVGTTPKAEPIKVPADILAGDTGLVQEETDALSRVASFGFPVGVSRESSYAMPSRTVEAGYYTKISSEIAKTIYNTYPVSLDTIPTGGAKYVSNRKITASDPITGLRKHRTVTGALDENGVGIFNNNPVVIAEMIRDGVPVEIPEGFDKPLNPSFVIRGNKVIDVLGPRADGKDGLVSMVEPIERSYTSEPNYGTLNEAAGLASLFLDDKNNERVIPSGAPVVNADGNISQDAGSATSVGELTANFALFMENALTNVRIESNKQAGLRGEDTRSKASTKLKDLLNLRGGNELDSSFFTTAAQAIHTEYMYSANLFEVRNALIDAGVTKETKNGLEIDPNRKKLAVKILESRLRPENKKAIAGRFAPFVNASAEDVNKNPNAVIDSFIHSMILNNKSFEGNVMPTINRIADVMKNRYAQQQDTRQIEERAKVTVSMDPAILDTVSDEALQNSAAYIGEVSTVNPVRITPNQISSYLNNAHDSAVMAIDGDANLRDALNDLVFQSIYKSPSPAQVNRIKGMTTTDVFGTLVNWISKGNYDHPEILSFERSLRSGNFDSGNELRSALNLVRMSSRTSLNGDPTKDTGYVRAVKSELSRSLGAEVSDSRAKDFIKAIDKSMRKRMSRSHITAAQVMAAVQLNTAEAAKLGIKSGDPQSVIDALQSVAKTSTNASHRLVADLLEDTNFIKTIKFEIGTADHSVAGEYNRLTDGTHSVFINMNGYNGRGLTNVLLEEYVHAFLSDVSNKPKESLTEKQNTAITRLKGLYDLVQKQADAQNITDPHLRDGLENIDEFISSFLLSQDFQALVKSVKPPTGQRGFFGRIIDSIVSLFRKVTGTEKNAYTQAMQDVLDLSRSAMRSDRLMAKSLFSSVANDASAMIDRAADAYDALPDSIKGVTAKLDTVDGVKAYLEEQVKLVKEANDRDVTRLHSEITADKMPQSLNETTAEQTAKAKTLLTIIRNMVPSEVRLRMLTKAEAETMGDESRFIASALADEITINPERMMAYVDGMDTLSAGKLIQSIITEEMGHVASYNALTNAEINAIADSLSDGEYDRIADAYYQTDEKRNAAKDSIRSEDPNEQRKEKRILVEEHLRAHLQRATAGNTTEDNAAFYRTNPSLFKIALRYVGNAFRKMTTINKNTGNDLVDAALTNMLVEMKALKMGYRNGPATMAFDPKNPSKSLEVIRALSQLDNREMIDDAAFNEDVASTLQSQIGLEDFKRIQKLARGTVAAEQEAGLKSEKVKAAEVIDFLVNYFNGNSWKDLADMFQNGFDDSYSFEESAGEYKAIPIGTVPLPTLIGDPNTPETTQFNAAVAYLTHEFSLALNEYKIGSRNIDPELVQPLASSLAEAVILDASDLMGTGYVQLTIDKDYTRRSRRAELVVSNKDVVKVQDKEIDMPKLKEIMLQVDGMTFKSEHATSSYIALRYQIDRGEKSYSLDFEVKPDKSIHVGTLFPIFKAGQPSGETVSNDSFGMELIMALLTNNHMIGAKSMDTFAAGSGREIHRKMEERKRDQEYFAQRGETYNPPSEMVFKGYKAWPKMGFDAHLSTSDIESMAATQDLITPFESAKAKKDWIKMVVGLATDEKGDTRLINLIHLGKDPKAGSIIWSNTGMGKTVVFDLAAGSDSMKAMGNVIEGLAPKSVKEVGDLRKVYSKKLKFLSADAELSDEDRANKIEETTETYKSALRALDIIPDRLLTSLGSGMNFDGSSMNFDSLIETLETPIFEEGTYQMPKNTFLRAIMGELDPRIKRLDDNRKAFNRAAALLVTKYKAKLDAAVAKEKPPTELVAAAMGSTGVELQPAVYDKAEDAHTARLIAIRNNAALSDEDRASEVYASKQLLDQELYDARVEARKVIARRKDEALAKLATIAPQTALHITSLRSQLIDPISKRLKQDYGVTETLGVHIDDQLGIYMTRAYRMFNEVGFADRVLKDPTYQEVRDRAIAFFDREFVKNESRRLQREEGILPADADIKAKDALENKRSSAGQSYGQKALISFIEGYANKTSAGAGAELGEGYRVLLNNLKTKKDIPFELRELLGEYKNSEEGTNNLLRTFTTVATMAANQSFLNNVRDLGVKNGFLVSAADYRAEPEKYAGFVPFRQSASTNYDPLLGMYAPKEMVEGFHKTFDSNTLRNNTNSAINIVDNSMMVLTKATGYAMAAKTLGSIGFYARNVLSNMLFFGPAQGFVRIDNMIKTAAQYSWAGLKDQNRIDSYIAELTALNMVGDEYQSSIIRDMINGKVDHTGIMKQVQDLMEQAKVNKVQSAVSTLVDKAQRLAAAGDAVFKIAYFENEFKVLKEAQKKSNTGSVEGMSDYQLKRMAAEKVLMTAQSASQAPKILSEVTKSGVGLLFAPFMRFKAEIPRITINTYKLAMNEIKDVNPDIRSRGVKRFASMTAMLGGVSMAIPTILRVLVSGIGDDEDEALRNSMPEYLRGHTFNYFGSGDNLKSVDLSFINPFSMVTDPALRALEQISRGNIGKAASQYINGMIFDQYLDDQIFAGAFADVKNNKNDTTGEPIWEENVDNTGEILVKGLGYLMDKAYAPRIVQDAIKAYQAVGGDYKDFDKSPIGLMLNGAYPVRIHDVDINKQYSRYLSEKKEQFDRITKKKYAAYADKPLTEDRIRQLYDDELNDRRLLNQDLLKISRGFEGLGMAPQEIYKNMTTRGGVSKRRANLLFQNIMDRPALNKDFFNGLLKRDFGEERAKILVDQMDSHPRYMFIEE